MKLVFSPLAQTDIQNIGDYVVNVLKNKTASKRIVKDIAEGCVLLKQQPLLGIAVRERFGWNSDYRVLVVGNYLVFYKIDKDIIRIYRVLDGRTDYIEQLF